MSYNFQVFANISGNFCKIVENIKFPKNLQPWQRVIATVI